MRTPLTQREMIAVVQKDLKALGLKPFQPALPPQTEISKVVKRPPDLAPFIEHTLLTPDATRERIKELCDQAAEYGFRGVCVNPAYVEIAKKHLLGTKALVISVVAFPFGASLTATKVEETRHVIEMGADEVDMVISIGALKQAAYQEVYSDVLEVVKIARKTPVKVILETLFLNSKEKIAGCLLAKLAGASYVKTSTGFGLKKTPSKLILGRATPRDVRLMRAVVGGSIGIKAAGGISTFKDAVRMIRAGATTLGCSRSVAIVKVRRYT